ncbi:probable LRR receptor-like serine/threonine-protein kinase At4g20450 [Prosopis cineraria]|uniref:probable LRR receptor-like serine/threonine-protein kinase At4g20450 n=1 Tax=Prosopis cineraria TaxID=364024 RepID=UPI0024109955|nr:probable LRR receptor-like serine/threonine-protein kinase At4g20450 [Prosopis cineraria]
MITGHPLIKRGVESSNFILDWVQPKIECGEIEGIVDPRLAGEFRITSCMEVFEVAMSCISATAMQRPDISHILQELQECSALEMDHDIVTRNSLGYTANYESMTILSAR